MLAKTPLATEIAALERTLENAEPPFVKRAREALAATREQRATVAARYDAECRLALEEKAQRPTPAMEALEIKLAELDKQIDTRRHEVQLARDDWRPTFNHTMASHLKGASANLLSEIEAVARLFSVYDDYVRDHALGSIAGGQPTRLSNSLFRVAADIRKLIQKGE